MGWHTEGPSASNADEWHDILFWSGTGNFWPMGDTPDAQCLVSVCTETSVLCVACRREGVLFCVSTWKENGKMGSKERMQVLYFPHLPEGVSVNCVTGKYRPRPPQSSCGH